MKKLDLKSQRWLRALAIAKIIFQEEGYFTTYLEEIEAFIMEQKSQVAA